MSKLQSSLILSSRIRNNSTLAKPPWAVVSYLVSLSKLSTAPAFAVGMVYYKSEIYKIMEEEGCDFDTAADIFYERG
ncbi:hypothetical protein ABQ274_10345 [Lactococcus lactis]|uniref:hypothetical protein n=1 Tax=Lactococcus lactis TaxID=1358 RepID=UPI00338FC979